MATITTGRLGTPRNDLISVSNPAQFVRTINGQETLLVWGGGGNDSMSVSVNFSIMRPDVLIWLYGDDTLFQPGTPRIGGPAGNDLFDVGAGWKMTGLGGRDIGRLHGGHYDKPAHFTDFDPIEGDRFIADFSGGWDLDSFRFVKVKADGPQGKEGVLRNFALDFNSDGPITDGQKVSARCADQGDGNHHDIRLEWGGRGEAGNAREAVADWVRDGIGDWLLPG